MKHRRESVMKSVLLILALCASTVNAQVGNRVSLELGTVTVWLGMDKAAVKQQVEARGMNYDDSSPNSVVVADLQAKRVFTLQLSTIS